MITKPDTSKMEYRYLGNSGLRVSVFGWGNWVNNQDDKLTLDQCREIYDNNNKQFYQYEIELSDIEPECYVIFVIDMFNGLFILMAYFAGILCQYVDTVLIAYGEVLKRYFL